MTSSRETRHDTFNTMGPVRLPWLVQVLRRTGPFPRRRKYRDLKGKKLTIKTGAQFKTLLVKEAFERLTVPPGKDALWEEPKSPSALQVLSAAVSRCVSAAHV